MPTEIGCPGLIAQVVGAAAAPLVSGARFAEGAAEGAAEEFVEGAAWSAALADKGNAKTAAKTATLLTFKMFAREKMTITSRVNMITDARRLPIGAAGR